MWKVLGVDALYVEFADVWKRRMKEISEDRDEHDRFVSLIDDAEIKHLFNGSTETHTFMVELPESIDPQDIQFLADEILDVARTADFDFMSLDGKYQRCQVIFESLREPEILGLDKAEGISAGAVFLPIVESWSKPGRRNDSL